MSGGARLAWGFVLLLAILHYDFWNWESQEVVLDFVPMGLAYQAALSLLAGLAWALVVRFDWPEDVEAWAARGPRDPEPADAERGTER